MGISSGISRRERGAPTCKKGRAAIRVETLARISQHAAVVFVPCATYDRADRGEEARSSMAKSQPEACGPCRGIRVIDFSTMISGPVCAQYLGDLGADVIKVEPLAGDMIRYTGGRPHAGLSGFFVQYNRNKRSIALDLKSPLGVEAACALVASADVVLENFRPGVAERLGIGYAALSARQPRLIYAAISGFGPDGPYAGQPAYDQIIQGLSGFMPVQGGAEGPAMIQAPLVDRIAGVTAATGILAALLERERSGCGQRVDIPMLDTYAAFVLPELMGPRSFVEAEATASEQVFRCFATLDGHVVGIAAQDSQFEALCRALGREDLLQDARFAQVSERFMHLAEFYEELAAELARRTTADFLEAARKFGAPFAEVLDLDGFFADPQVRHNETLQVREVDGVGGLRYLRPPLRFSRSPSGIQLPPPRLGEHSDEVLAEIGYTPEQSAALREAGTLR